MKNLISFLILAALLVSCQQKAKVTPVDLNAEKASIIQLMDKQIAALKARDAKTELSFLTDDAILLGTDPKEFWNKAQTTEMINQMLADTTLKVDLTPERREIYVSPDGNSAIVVDQMFVGFISTKVQVRRITQLIKTNGSWMINFDSSSMIPKNEDLPAINKALEGK
ncbi:MAG TPA: nuclear transport factor 2 family protein [Bacteroidales bacterium]|nr:nuclear transport factor 2 family protein [Bacteroidales bacterium]